MSFEIVAAAPDSTYGKLTQNGNPPTCDQPPFTHKRYFGGDKKKPFCTKTIARFWDAQEVAGEGDLPVAVNDKGVSVICLGKGSLMYHGYKGIKNHIVDRGTTSGLRHAEEKQDTCETEDTLKCYHRVTFPWMDLGFPFEKKPFFFGPKTTADVYGANKQNTVVVAHKVPSGKFFTRQSQTDNTKLVPLYQIPLRGGTTITFELVRDVNLVDIGSVDNAEKFIAWLKKASEKQNKVFSITNALREAREQLEEHEFKEGFEYLAALDQTSLDNNLEKIERAREKYGEDALISGDPIESVFNLYEIIKGEDESRKVKRTSYFERDDELVRLVRLWLEHEGLKGEIDGWFWGGDRWKECSGNPGHQEFCFFNPKGLLEHTSHTEPKVHKIPGLPVYDDFWEKATTAEDVSVENVVNFPSF